MVQFIYRTRGSLTGTFDAGRGIRPPGQKLTPELDEIPLLPNVNDTARYSLNKTSTVCVGWYGGGAGIAPSHPLQAQWTGIAAADMKKPAAGPHRA